MRIIHTSDWHLGKNLEGFSRMEEQIKFCEDFIKLVEEKNADLVLIAGDIYDNSNPPASAEKLFYDTINKISKEGRRCVFVISGNHDNPDRLESVIPLAIDKGITILGYPMSEAKKGKFANFEVIETKEGFTKIKIGDEIINIISIAYPSEKRLNDAFSGFEEITDLQQTYSKKIGGLFGKLEENFNEDEINIATSHIFVVGSEISDSERRIELGGALLVEKSDLPKKSQYTALGHIHKPQCISKKFNAYYSGSPLQYSKKERSVAKSVYLVDIKAGESANVEQVFINNYKPILVFKCRGIDEALDVAKKHAGEEIYSYFEINAMESINQEDIKEIKRLMKYVVEIKPIYETVDFDGEKNVVEISKSNIIDFFTDFYKKESEGAQPSEEVLNLFGKLISSEEGSDLNEAD